MSWKGLKTDIRMMSQGYKGKGFKDVLCVK